MELIKKYEKVALSDKQVLKIVNGRANIILYPDLIYYNDIDEILNPYGSCFLLFEIEPSYGHWCCIFKKENKLEFFNSYGGFPDDSLKYIPDDFKDISNQNYPYLTRLLLKSNYDIYYNQFKFQKSKSDITTCGRHCAFRLLFKDMKIEKYKEFMDILCKYFKLDPDELVTFFTLNIHNL